MKYSIYIQDKINKSSDCHSNKPAAIQQDQADLWIRIPPVEDPFDIPGHRISSYLLPHGIQMQKWSVGRESSQLITVKMFLEQLSVQQALFQLERYAKKKKNIVGQTGVY